MLPAGEGWWWMTQNLRVKWVLGLVSANAVMGAIALGLGVHQYRSIRGQAESAREQLRTSELDVAGLKASLASRPVTCPQPPSQPQADPQLTQTLQVIATGQQALLLRALQQTEPAPAAVKSQPSARRAPRRRRPVTTCAKPVD
jgi:hypothetical protein